ncbi:MAG: transcriptional repressor [Desulfobacteraceae bacterium]|nr:transcriptional repressor [Desulfobacteraceae bacterium]
MCEQCNYKELLKSVHLEPTEKRLRVLEVIGNNTFPLSASDIHDTLDRNQSINRVTVYRILDLLVDKKIVDRISTGGRAAYYGLGPNEHHQAHPHFYCKSCGQMDCLNPGAMAVEMSNFKKTFPGRIDKLELRLDGICKNCLKKTIN